MKRTLTLPSGEVWEFEVKSPYEKCEVCGRPYLSFGRPCDHVDRRRGQRLMPNGFDNPAEWQMLCDRYGAGNISRCGRYATIENSDGTYRYEQIV